MALLQVIEWRDETGQEIVHRWPEAGPGNVSLGAQLTVRESQAAVFFRDGQALDVFGTGRHTLTSLNIPLLQTLVNLPFGATTPFQAEVYFVNLRVMTNLKWGTSEPVLFRDKELDFVRLRAFGQYTLRVQDPQLFVNMVVGTEHVYTQTQVEEWLRTFIVTRFTDTMGQTLTTLLDLAQNYNELGVAVKSRVGEDMARYGLELIDLLMEAITPPEEVAQMLDQRAAMRGVGDMRTFLQFQTAKAIGEIPQAGGGEGGGVVAAGAGMGVGIGAGAAMGGAMGQALKDAFTSPPAAPVGAAAAPGMVTAPTVACPACGAEIPAGVHFCPSCGANLQGAACAACGAQVPAGAKFCPQCGQATGR